MKRNTTKLKRRAAHVKTPTKIVHKLETLQNAKLTNPEDLTGTVGNKSTKLVVSIKEKKRRRILALVEKQKREKRPQEQIRRAKATSAIVKEKDATLRNRKVNDFKDRTWAALEKNKNVVKERALPPKSNKKVHDLVDNAKERAQSVIDNDQVRRVTRKVFSATGAAYQASKARLSASISKNPKMWKYGTMAAVAMIAVGTARNLWNSRAFNRNNQVIPENYDRGYDIINQNITDFGSPLKLFKTASKTITPYYSSVRRGVKTSVNAVRNRNISLKMHDNAIRHTRY